MRVTVLTRIDRRDPSGRPREGAYSVKQFASSPRVAQRNLGQTGALATVARDSVCGVQVDEKKAAATSVYQGATYHFCAPGCKVTFDKSPEEYAGKGGTRTGH